MKKTTKFVATTVVIGAVGVGASLFLIPQDQNLQQMQVRDDALRSATFINYEQSYLSGNRESVVIIGYSDQLISLDRAADALPILNEHLQANPTDVAARSKLAQIYQLTGNNEAYFETLNWLAQNANDEDSLRLLSDHYNSQSDFASQVAVLKRLIEVTNGAYPKTFVDLATIQTALGDKAGASETLGILVQKHPSHMDFGTLRLYVLALLDQGDASRAQQYAGRWLADNFVAAEAADLANIMHYNASAQNALTLLQPYENVVTSNSNLLAAFVNALVASGQDERAFGMLKQHAAVTPLNDALLTAYIPLSVKYATPEEALRVVQAINPNDFSEVQAIELIRLAKGQENTELTEQVVIEFIDEDYLIDKPVLDAIITLDGQNLEAANAKIAVAIAGPISSDLRIQLANACAEAGNTACVESILDALPAIAEMTPSMLSNTAELYLSLGRAAEIYPDVTTYRTANPSGIIDQIWLRLVAATGDKATMQAWLEANDTGTTATNLRELYYTATSFDHYQTGSIISEHLYKRAATEENKALMVNAYLRTYQYSKALPYLREAKGQSAQLERDYITALEVLAKRDSGARKELVGYVQKKLGQAGLSQSEKRRMVFLLINNGREDVARPIIEANARKSGGQWRVMLDQLNGKGGGGGPTDPVRVMSPQERVAVASEEGVSRERRREIAFGLKEDGHHDAALHIFNRLASGAAPGSEDVNDLLFLLEQRSPQDALTWMDARRRNANSQAERLAWSQLIADKSDPYAFMALISSDPSLLQQPTLRDRYFVALAENGSEAEYTQAMRPWIEATNDVDGLIQYARIAEGQSYRQAAVNAYKRAYALDGNNTKALHDLGVSAFLQADYSEARKYLDRYFNVRSRQQRSSENPFLAAYYQAEMLRRGGDKGAAQNYFRQAFEGARILPNQSVGSQSIMYSSLFHLGRADEAINGFRTLLQRFPRNRTLLADYMTVLIEYKYYDEAQRIANQYDYTPSQQAGTPISSNDNEETFYRFVPASEEVSSFQQTDETLRLQLLYARIELENGDRSAALNRLGIMKQYYPNNPELMGYTASIESAGGNYNKALQLLNQAQELTPQNEDIAQLKKNINRVHGQHVKIDHEWRRIGNSDEQITTLAGKASIDATTEVGMVLQNDEIDASQVRRTSDGAIIDEEYSKQRGQLYLNSYTDAGSRHQFSLFGNSSDVGAGYAYAFNNSLGRTDLIVDYHRPYWDFTQAVIEDANRDRIGLTHSAQLSESISFFGETSLNRYNLQGEADAASSYLLRMSFVKKIRDAQPYFGVGYGFDGEYMIDKERRRTAANVEYASFDLTAREIHFISAIFQHAFTQSLTGDLVAGYAFDRLGDHGPSVEGRLTQELTDSIEAQARFRYGLETNNSDDNASTVGGHLLWRY